MKRPIASSLLLFVPALVLFAAGTPASAFAQDAPSGPPAARTVRAVRIAPPAVAPALDGLLTDPAWAAAPVFSEFRMVEPEPNAAPTERTELRILFDDTDLYIGLFCADSEPSRIAANSMAHDGGGGSSGFYGYGRAPSTSSDDLLRVLIDPFQDKRTAYVFFINPRGARSEGLASGGSSSLNWDGIWEGRSRILPDGWSAEFRIPFKTLQFKPGLTVWGLNVERTIARKQEKVRLSGTNRDSNFYNPMEAASLSGIENVKQGMGFTFRPYGLGSVLVDRSAAPSSTSWKADGGFDLYKNFTPNFVGALSYRMDFAETEADERRINLTRFPLFFPEKRMFFLEGSEVFNFRSSVSFRPFFSRTIGLAGGEQVPVLWGAKVYGKLGRTNLAALDVQTGEGGGLPGSNFFAARLTQDLFAESKIGWIFTNGSPSGARNTLAGMDLQYSSSRFFGNKNIMLAAWGAYNWNDKTDGRHHGFGFRADYPNDLWNVQTTYAFYGEALDPGMGYMMRKGIQTGYIRVAYQPRPAPGGGLDRLVRQFYLSASGDYYWKLDGRLETKHLQAQPFGFRTESGEYFSFEVNQFRDVLPYDFEVAEGVVLKAGDYSYTSYQLQFNTAVHRAVSFEGQYDFGRFYSGQYDNISLAVTVKIDGYVNLSFDSNFVKGRLPEGNFSENVYQLKADFFLTPDLGFMNYVQYDDISRSLGWNARLRWQIKPGNEVYLVYNKGWERRWDPLSRFVPMEERGVLKFTLSIRP
jgi:hypothetical protein